MLIQYSSFSPVCPTVPGSYPVQRTLVAKGFSQFQVVRLFESGLAIGPGWLEAKPAANLPFLWGPRIEAEIPDGPNNPGGFVISS